jgi:prepilin-type N-terminal cleavage/methylation domain-containing protein
MDKTLTNPRGFTLVEIIISIAMLSVLSVYMLQLFVQSANMNRKAYELDRSVMITQNIVELIGQADTPTISGNGLYALRLEGSGPEKRGRMYFDEGFSSIESDEGPKYSLEISVTEAGEEVDGRNLYDISMKMTRSSGLPLGRSEDRDIYSLSSTKFLKSWE